MSYSVMFLNSKLSTFKLPSVAFVEETFVALRLPELTDDGEILPNVILVTLKLVTFAPEAANEEIVTFVAFTPPTTSKFVDGLVVPIPTNELIGFI